MVKDIVETTKTTFTIAERLSIPCPEPLLHDDGYSLDADGLPLFVSQPKAGRIIDAYNFNGSLLYKINLDASELNWESQSGYTSMDMNDNFLCASDQNKVVLWNNKNGKLVNIIQIVEHYNRREDPDELSDLGCCKGHHSLIFNEHSIVIFQNRKNFPMAADFINFW